MILGPGGDGSDDDESLDSEFGKATGVSASAAAIADAAGSCYGGAGGGPSPRGLNAIRTRPAATSTPNLFLPPSCLSPSSPRNAATAATAAAAGAYERKASGSLGSASRGSPMPPAGGVGGGAEGSRAESLMSQLRAFQRAGAAGSGSPGSMTGTLESSLRASSFLIPGSEGGSVRGGRLYGPAAAAGCASGGGGLMPSLHSSKEGGLGRPQHSRLVALDWSTLRSPTSPLSPAAAAVGSGGGTPMQSCGLEPSVRKGRTPGISMSMSGGSGFGLGELGPAPLPAVGRLGGAAAAGGSGGTSLVGRAASSSTVIAVSGLAAAGVSGLSEMPARSARAAGVCAAELGLTTSGPAAVLTSVGSPVPSLSPLGAAAAAGGGAGGALGGGVDKSVRRPRADAEGSARGGGVFLAGSSGASSAVVPPPPPGPSSRAAADVSIRAGTRGPPASSTGSVGNSSGAGGGAGAGAAVGSTWMVAPDTSVRGGGGGGGGGASSRMAMLSSGQLSLGGDPFAEGGSAGPGCQTSAAAMFKAITGAAVAGRASSSAVPDSYGSPRLSQAPSGSSPSSSMKLPRIGGSGGAAAAAGSSSTSGGGGGGGSTLAVRRGSSTMFSIPAGPGAPGGAATDVIGAASDRFPRDELFLLGSSASSAEDGRSEHNQLGRTRLLAASGGSDSSSGFELPPCTGELRDPIHGCWLHDYVAWHKANRGKPDAKYLIWICYGPGGPGASRARTANVYGDNCAGLGDRMRGIQYLTRVAAYTKRVLLVYQESPAPMERFLYPALIDWRLTPDLQIDPELDIVKRAKHYRIAAVGRNRLRDDMASGAFHNLTARVVTVSTNKPAHTGGSGLIPRLSPNGTAVGILARALFRLSPEVEKATDDALLGLGIQPGQPYVAAHLRLGGLSGEQFLLGRFSHTPPQILAAAAACAANLTRVYGHVRPAAAADARAADAAAAAAAAAGADMPYVLVTDNHELRAAVSEGKLRPWVTPELQPAHFMMSELPRPEQQQQQQPGKRRSARQQHEHSYGEVQAIQEDGDGASEQRSMRRRLLTDEPRHRGRRRKRGDGAVDLDGAAGAGGARSGLSVGSTEGAGRMVSRRKLDKRTLDKRIAAALEQVARLQILNMADLGILMRASCVLISPSGFSIQAHLLSGQRCAMRLQDCPGAT
ncbi:hypothetical protein HXX76_001816 [Chlamydomonas incerta]|uniref:O-fucosyltransferase family protein n=1 Tax=Chlamydomonas incerta TaxID=51695 RepID=A0A835W9P7_CHLIN|nr:hypothetical protein HXX76_001816 [Chlamydomonas incerta]|eukprot:KAG2443459.1 hypothetical protein HXX76_001816 [Chlamydomonas incerta]